MALVRLMSWDRDTATRRARELRKAGFTVDAKPPVMRRLVGQFVERPIDVMVLDLGKAPSMARAVAAMLRQSKSASYFPIVFAGGDPKKAQALHREMPGTFLTTWEAAAKAVNAAMKSPRAAPDPKVTFADLYAGSSLAKKLGLKAGIKVAIVAAPEGFDEQFEEIEVQGRIAPDTELAIWFARSRAELERLVDLASLQLPEGRSLWIAYPKQAGSLRCDFTQFDVREAGLAVGLVDYKICSIDADWSGLKFARKRK
jgi:hypothetical protein